MRISILHYTLLFSIFPLLISCQESKTVAGFPATVSVPSERVDIEGYPPIYIGGYGSDMAYNREDSTFWLLTDRGPNVDGATTHSKVFPLADYTPHIGVFKWKGDTLSLIRKISLKENDSTCFCGLPRSTGEGITGEKAYAPGGSEIITAERKGIDTEGLAVSPDGTFWVSDEYGPYLLHFNADGILIEEYSPFNGKLPAHYALRQPNRGMEGLCIGNDGKRLYGIMQSPLDGDCPEIFKTNIPLLVIDTESGACREYAYTPDSRECGVSALVYLNDTTLLVLERDGKFPGDGEVCKRIYRITLPDTDTPCLLSKTLVADLLQVCPGYDHDKPEGMALINDSTLGVVNDDDFGIEATVPAGCRYRQKLKNNGRTDRNEIFFFGF